MCCWLVFRPLVPMDAVPNYVRHIIGVSRLIQVGCQFTIIQDIPNPVAEVIISRGNMMTKRIGSHMFQAISHIGQAIIDTTINGIKTLLADHTSQHHGGFFFRFHNHSTSSIVIIPLIELISTLICPIP